LQRYTPYFREAGSGPGVVCLHANASTSSQWRGLMERLCSSHRVFAPDSFGVGRSPSWCGDRAVTLSDEVELLSPVFDAASDPFYLVGHSYGAAIALIAALAYPQRIRALVLYEPTLFALLEEEAPGQEAANGIRSVAEDAASAIAVRDHAVAAERFIDYWMGAGTWARMPQARQAVIEASMVNTENWARALFSEPTPLGAFHALKMPVLYMVGARSPSSSRGVAALLTRTLPNVTVLEFEDMGHMGPVTHPETVNEAIMNFLASVPGLESQ
jgi:pimeloyl-ACP methyl ester carboxylesterase